MSLEESILAAVVYYEAENSRSEITARLMMVLVASDVGAKGWRDIETMALMRRET